MLKIILKVMRRRKNIDGTKSKLEEVGDFEYYGPFTLFQTLYRVIEDYSGNNIHLNLSSVGQTNLQEIKEYSLDDKLLQINVPELRIQHEDVFWNLVYLFMTVKIDYRFI